MSYMLVYTDSQEFYIVDGDYVTGRTLGSRVKVYLDPMDSSYYDATLIDSGTREEMFLKESECRELTAEQIQAIIAAPRARRQRPRAKRAAQPSVAAPTVVDGGDLDDDTDVDPSSLSDRELLLSIFKEMKSFKTEVTSRIEKMEAEITSVTSFMQLAADNRESDNIELLTIAKSMENQEDVIAQVEKGIDHITKTMPQKLDVNYTLLTEAEVSELDTKEDSIAMFAAKLADRLFTQHEKYMHVDYVNQHTYNWIVDTVFRRRAYSGNECGLARRNVQSKIRSHLNQRARRLCELEKVTPTVPMMQRKKEERQMQLANVAARVREVEAEVTEKRKRIIDVRVEKEADIQLRKRGYIDNQGDPILYSATRPSAPPTRPLTPITPHHAPRATVGSSLFDGQDSAPFSAPAPRTTQSSFDSPQGIHSSLTTPRRGPMAAPGRGARRICYPRGLDLPGPSRPSPSMFNDEQDDYDMPEEEQEEHVPDYNAQYLVIDGEIVPTNL